MQHDNANIVNVNSFFSSIETGVNPESQPKSKIIDAITKKKALDALARGESSLTNMADQLGVDRHTTRDWAMSYFSGEKLTDTRSHAFKVKKTSKKMKKAFEMNEDEQ